MRLLVASPAIALILVIAAVVPAGATPITFDFTGTVTQFNADPDDPFGGTIGFGTAFSGSYTFESTTPDAAADPQTGSYLMAGPPFGLTVDIGGNLFSTTDFLGIGVANDFALTTDQYTVLACAGDSSCSGDLHVELFLQDDTGAVFSSDALPLVAPALTSFTFANFFLVATVSGNFVEIEGTLDSLTGGGGAPIPEPGTLLLIGAGTGMCGVSRWRRRTRPHP